MMYKRGDTVRMRKRGAPGFEEKQVLSFDGETLVFSNGKRLHVDNINEDEWHVEKVGPRSVYIIESGGVRVHLPGEFILYREDSPPWEVRENLVGTQQLADGSIERSWVADDVADDVAVEGPQFLKYSASGKLLESRDISPTDPPGQ